MKGGRAALESAHCRQLGSERKAVDMSAGALMVLFCLALGLQQVAIKGVADDISPLAQIALRSLIAGTLVAFFVYWRGIRYRDLRARWWPGLFVGLGFAAEFALVAWGLNYTLASHMSVFLYTAPIFAALGLHFLVPGERLSRLQWLGVVCAFAGMVIAMAPTAGNTHAADVIIGDALGVLAGLAWAMTTVMIRRTSLADAPAELTLSYQLGALVLTLLPAAWLLGHLSSITVTGPVIASLGFQSLVISFGALLLWFALLRRYRAAQLGVFSFLAPLFGVLFGVMLLNEPLSPNFMIGGGVMLAGIVLVTR